MSDETKPTAAYAKENVRNYQFGLIFNTDADIIEKLEQEENMSGYIKRLIREDIKQNPD